MYPLNRISNPDGSTILPADAVAALARAIRKIQQALASFHGKMVSADAPGDPQYRQVHNSHDLRTAQAALDVLGWPPGERRLTTNEADLLRRAQHDLSVAVMVYDGAELESGQKLDLSEAVNASKDLAHLIGSSPGRIADADRLMERVRTERQLTKL